MNVKDKIKMSIYEEQLERRMYENKKCQKYD